MWMLIGQIAASSQATRPLARMKAASRSSHPNTTLGQFRIKAKSYYRCVVALPSLPLRKNDFRLSVPKERNLRT
jgi:hypothetical protein